MVPNRATYHILELHEMIRVLHVVAFPMVFILICDLGRHGEHFIVSAQLFFVFAVGWEEC